MPSFLGEDDQRLKIEPKWNCKKGKSLWPGRESAGLNLLLHLDPRKLKTKESKVKTFINIGLNMMAISTLGCATSPSKAQNYQGRLIEFKSGPEGFDTRTFFYEGKNEVIAFDSQFTPDLAQKSIEHLRTLTQKPISWLILTHPNPDKFNGASVFKAVGARILSSKATAESIAGVHSYKEYYFVEMAKMFKKGEYPQPIPVDEVFEGEMDLVLQGGEKIHLRELQNPGVSNTQTVAYIKSNKALIVGDLIHYKAHAWLEGGIVNGKPTPTIAGWISDLRELKSTYPGNTIVYGGRGVSTNLESAVDEQVNYLKSAQALVRKTLKAMGSNAKDFLGPKASELYKDLALNLQAQFPDYALAYMIEYGSYGLVQSELERLH